MTATRLWSAAEPLVLASGSLTRRDLLESAGIPVQVQAAAIDERAVEVPLLAAGESPDTVAAHLARAKAMAVSALFPGRLVLGADQTLSLGTRGFHKPVDLQAAAEQLAALQGQSHQLNSAVALVRDGSVLWETVGIATLTVRPLSRAFIALYLAEAGPAACSSVGAYQLEGLGIHLFERIEGDQPTVLGLPLLPLLEAFRTLGVVPG